MPSDQWTVCRVRVEVADALDKLASAHQTTRAAMAEALLWYAIEEGPGFYALGDRVVKRHRHRDDWRHGRTTVDLSSPTSKLPIPETKPIAPTRRELKARNGSGIPYTPLPGVK